MLLLVAVLGLGSCGTKNIADCEGSGTLVPCSEKTPEEQAKIYMDDGKFDDAITVLEDAITADVARYGSYPFLAAAYAGKAGFDIFNIVKSNLGSKLVAESNFLDTVGQFLPDPVALGSTEYAARVKIMNKAVDRLNSMPASQRTQDSGVTYVKSAAFLLPLYQMASSAMSLKLFNSSTTGKLDPDKLKNMTAAEADAILANLTGAAAAASQGQTPEVQAQISAAVDAIQSQPGADNKEKLQNYMTAKG